MLGTVNAQSKGDTQMSTWIEDLKKKNPSLAADYAVVGNQSSHSLRNMVRALSTFTYLNTPEDERRLAAAKRILKVQQTAP
jgi:hypothetical protein